MLFRLPRLLLSPLASGFPSNITGKWPASLIEIEKFTAPEAVWDQNARRCCRTSMDQHSRQPPIVNFPPKDAVSHKRKRRTPKVELREEAEWSRCLTCAAPRRTSSYVQLLFYRVVITWGDVLRHAPTWQDARWWSARHCHQRAGRSAYGLEASEQHNIKHTTYLSMPSA